MRLKRYQLWMAVMFFAPGNAVETRTQGRVNFAYRIIDRQAVDFRAQRAQLLEDGFLYWGHSDDTTALEQFAREMEGQQ